MSLEKEEKIKEIITFLRKKGYKATDARKKVLRVFAETEYHLKPQDIHQRLKNEDVSLPTVYRSIDLLKKIDIIKEISIGDERYYELYMFSRKKLHMHFQCTRCGKIQEYNNRDIFNSMLHQQEYIEKTYGDQIEDISIVTKGLCRKCKKVSTGNNSSHQAE